MTEIDEGSELRFLTRNSINLDDPRIKQVLTRMSHLGIEPQFEVPEIEPITLREFAQLSPVTSLASYLGQEHFKLFGDEAGIVRRLSTRGFNRIISPLMRPPSPWGGRTSNPRVAKQNAEIESLYEELGVVTVARSNVGMPEVPVHLKKLTHAAIAGQAVQVSSVLAIAEHIDRFQSLVTGVGDDTANGIVVISGRVQAHLDGFQGQLFES